MRARTLVEGALVAAFVLPLAVGCGSNADAPPSVVDSDSGGRRNSNNGGQGNRGDNTGGITIITPTDTGGDGGNSCTGPSANCVFQVVDPGPVCGDGIIDDDIGEVCDDGNSLPGDGCSGVCQLEPNAVCPAEGSPCHFTVGCGNGEREPGEACDDGNTLEEDPAMGEVDGCSANCAEVHPGFQCPTPGEPCIPATGCGDGRLQPGETCDDGGACTGDGTHCTDDAECGSGTCEPVGGDGCTDKCRVETGYRCVRIGQPCEPLPVCGNGRVEPGEGCDDGNQVPSDGCSIYCQIESSDWDCSVAGEACVGLFECGNGELEVNEQCDDGNTQSGDGCKANCTLQSGYRCSVPGKRCVPLCGDGVWIRGDGLEQCDDGNAEGGDGCSAKCQVEPGWVCDPDTGADCYATACGDGDVEGDEVCDEGSLNGLFYGDGSGCSTTCTQEPRCRVGSTTGACTSTCGDGIKLDDEDCDDGNLANGDGCNSSCEIETAQGFSCEVNVVDDTYAGGTMLDLPVLVRDFTSYAFSGGHPDFFHDNADRAPAMAGIDPGFVWPNVTGCDGARHGENILQAREDSNRNRGDIPNEVCEDLVIGTLDADGKPIRNSNAPACNGLTTMIASQDSFEHWYRNTNLNDTYLRTLTLELTTGNTYQYETDRFFPVDGVGDTFPCADNPYASWGCKGDNYWFTSEIRYLFRHDPSESRILYFRGDDDVWVFVNGQLAVDLGGTHEPREGSVAISAARDFGMEAGRLYEIVVFHAERHPVDSNYLLSLTNFTYEQSSCDYECGDGLETVFEECDLGAAQNNGAYNGCTANCEYGPFCGDGVTNGPEECDDGVNTTVVGTGCGPGCLLPPRCGDSVVQASEQCDRGEAGNTGGYDGCTDACTLGPYCGDGRVQEDYEEECDDGINDGTVDDYGLCQAGCRLGPRCGDGIVQDAFGELCDEGADNGNPDSGCDVDCGLPAVCGDGIVQASEDCDDGVNDGSYGGCAYDCRYGPRCGDGVLQGNEACDLGAANQNGLYGGCSANCQIGPHCGDGVLQEGTTEECDDGNDSNDDECTTYCKRQILLPH